MTTAPQLKVIVYGAADLRTDNLLITVFTGKTAPPGDSEAMKRHVERTVRGQSVLFYGHGWDVLSADVIDGRVIPWLKKQKKPFDHGYKVIC